MKKLSYTKITLKEPEDIISDLDSAELKDINEKFSIINFDSLYSTTPQPPSDDYEEPKHFWTKGKIMLIVFGVILSFILYMC
jgi:hypothetical protein